MAAAVVNTEGLPGEDEHNSALRFEDLTIDDDLPLLERVVRYCRSGIALQRLVHVKMLAETAETVGIWPRSCHWQLCMIRGVGPRQKLSVEQILQDPSTPRMFVEAGYKAVTSAIVSHLHTLITDVDTDVRRAASESLSALSTQIQKKDVASVLVSIPVSLAREVKPLKGMPDGFHEELRITACHLLAELAGAAEHGKLPPECVSNHIWPAVSKLCRDPSFRVRRCAAQALPRILGGTGSLSLAQEAILPAFEELSGDDMYRVRKSTGECLVDMSRSLVIVAQMSSNEAERNKIKAMRRMILIPIALQLLSDANKFVRHGMMQFLGPFIASFYPLEAGTLDLPGTDAADPVLEGIGSQFFPHASSMVSRLNASGSTTTSSPTPTPATLDPPTPQVSERQILIDCLPEFVPSNRISYLTLSAVARHRRENPPDPEDLRAIQSGMLGQFCALATIATGDDNTDAEMSLLRIFLSSSDSVMLSLQRLRSLSSDAWHLVYTLAHVLGSAFTVSDLLPVYRQHFAFDTDESVRLNVIRNFPLLFSLLPSAALKAEYLALWRDIVKGEDLLGAHKRSATDPMLLNWRQRDHVSRSLPELIGLASSAQVYEHIWPIVKLLLVDSVSLVREDAEWSIPLLLRAFCSENVKMENAKQWSADICQEVILWLKETILGSSKKGEGNANYSKRQLYCSICSTVGFALRFGDFSPQWDERYRHLLPKGVTESYVAYQTLSTAERQHLRRLLVYDLLPPALEMKSDRVTNVRLTLMKILQSMPGDVRSLSTAAEVLQELEDEWVTWESFNGGENALVKSPQKQHRPEELRAAI
ncbi:regulatory subunit [Fragilaria crotonensis]|nr:regulatory subunit [Fragilaria crotonensis]